MSGEPVPADDLAGTPVPANDLPSGGAPQNAKPVTGTPQQQPGMLERALPYMDPRGPAEAATAMATGMGGQIAGGLAGLVGAALPGPAGQGADVSQRVSQALTYSPRSKSGEMLLKAAELPAIPIHKAAEWVGERGSESPLLGALGKASVEALPAMLGARAGMAPGRPLTSAEQRVAQARDQGFKMTPEEMGAGVIPRTAASLAGEPRLAKLTSSENAATATTKAKGDIGLRADAAMDLDELALIRKQEGAAYEGARTLGPVAMDQTYMSTLDGLAKKYKSAADEFPGADKVLQLKEIEDTLAMLRKEDPAIATAQAQGIKLPPSATAGQQVFQASGAVDLISALRESADSAFRSGKNALAKVMRGGADALQEQLERHAAASPGQEAIVQKMVAARKRIAQTYAIEDALVGDKVNPRALGGQVEDRKPLDGGLKETGDFARHFDRSSQKPTHMPTGATFADIALSALKNPVGGLGWDIASIAARPGMRHILASQPAQWAMDPRTNLSAPALEALAVSNAPPPPQMQKR